MDWRSSNNNRMDDYDANFKRIVDARPVSKTEPVDEIPEELQPLTAGKAAALGWTDNEWKREEAIRMFKVNQYMDTVNANKHADAKRKIR